VSEKEEELELQALQRELDDAFATTRPRRGFDHELWARMQSARPASSRVREALAGFWQGVRTIPAVPAAAVAAGLVVVIGVGFLAYSGIRLGPRGGGNAAMSNAAPVTKDLGQAGFGKLPSPPFGRAGTAPPLSTSGAEQYAGQGPVQFVWAGQFDSTVPSAAPVFRYDEPTTAIADQFASTVGAALRDRPEGFLGEYSTSDYSLKVRGTISAPVSTPAYFIFASSAMPPVNAAGATPDDLAREFLAEHNLYPDWSFAVMVDRSGDPVRVRYQRQFYVGPYGPVYLVDYNGTRYGLEVDLSANRPVLASGLLPVPLQSSTYGIMSERDAIMPQLATPTVAGSSPPLVAVLTHVELVYVLVPAGDHSFYEPAYLFSGNVQVGGKTYAKNLLVPAVVPSQRNP
jgi:hypothetical protein